MEPQTAARYRLLDELRGLDLISMMLYHGMWDVVFLFGVAQKWYTGRPGFVWQQSICWVFILLSGFCAPFGRYMLRRGTALSAVCRWSVCASVCRCRKARLHRRS